MTPSNSIGSNLKGGDIVGVAGLHRSGSSITKEKI
jgi:hypothetical protein